MADFVKQKKLQLEQRDKNIQLLASLAPKTGTSLSLLSSATLGQTPLAPTSAQERNEGREDRVVRKGIDRLRKRHGDGSDSNSEEETRGGKGKSKGKEEVIDETAPVDQAKVKSVANNVKTTSKRKSKQTDWNPNLLPTAPESSSSEFDSSDSDNDSEPEAGPSTVNTSVPRSPSPIVIAPAAPPPRQAVSSALKSVTTPGGALKSVSVAGGALKKGTNGSAIAPRVEIRRKQRVVSLSRLR